MADKKKQHYVPRFYLKYFGYNSGKNISIYNCKSNLFIKCAALKKQAYEDYIYGKDGKLETILGKIECRFKWFIDFTVMFNGQIHLTKNMYLNILQYIVIQDNRTILTKEHFEKQYTEMIKLTLELDPKYNYLHDKSFDLSFKDVLPYCISQSAQMFPLLADLDYRILVNETMDEFITSDNPVVKYNMFTEKNKMPSGGYGYISKGLQIFVPLTKKYMLFLFDKNVYKLKSLFTKRIYLKSKGDVKVVNGLQYLNCLENIFFTDNVSEYYIRRLLVRYKKYRKENYNPVKEYQMDGTINNHDKLVRFQERTYRINMDLSFVLLRFKLLTKKNKNKYYLPRSTKLLKQSDLLFQDKNLNSTTASTQ